MFTTQSKKVEELQHDMAVLRSELHDLREVYQRLNEALGGALERIEALGGALERIERLEGKNTLSHFSRK